MAYTSTDLDNLQAAMASGARVVSIAGMSVEFSSADELKKRMNEVQASLDAADGKVRTTRIGTYSSKGF